MKQLEVCKIVKSYQSKEVLKGVDFCLEKGEILGIIGANGCGKSTLLSILAGVQKPDRGEIKIDGKRLERKKTFSPKEEICLFRDYIGYVPQENPLMEELSVYDNLRLWYAQTEKSLKEDLEKGTAARLGLKEVQKVPACRLSGGMKKRLSIACAMAKENSVLVLDEPGAALDFPTKQDIGAYLKEYAARGGAVVLTSHEEAELAYCTRLVALSGGKIVQVEPGMSKEEWVENYFDRESL